MINLKKTSRFAGHDITHGAVDTPAPEVIFVQDIVPQSLESLLDAQLQRYFAAHGSGLPAPGLYDRLLKRIEQPLIAQTLRATGGNQIRAAEVLGLNRNTLRKKMRLLGIDAKQPVAGLKSK